MSFKITVVIPTYNRKEYLRQLLCQLHNQKINVATIEVVVVVDGSTDGTLEMLKEEFSNVHIVIGNGQWWFTKSLNVGIKYALKFSPDFILTMNDDGTIKSDFLKYLVSAHEKKGRDSLIGAITITKDKPPKITFSGVKKIDKILLRRIVYIEHCQDVSKIDLTGIYFSKTLMTRGLLIPVRVFDEIGFFDQNFPQYGSDEDFTLRANNQGFKCYISWDAVVYDNNLLTSIGTPSNKPTMTDFIESIFYKYSVNYIPKTMKFYLKHGYPILLPIYFFIRILGLLNAFFFKYNTNTAK